MESPGHRANLLEPAYREIGIGLAYGAPERQVAAAQGRRLHDDVRGRRALSTAYQRGDPLSMSGCSS